MVEAGPKLLRGLLEAFVLESLEHSPKHGYALLKELSEAFGTEPNRNRLYPLLGRLVRDGYVMETSDGPRTLYALTERGREALDAYRRAPASFRETLARIWSVPTGTRAPAQAPTQVPVVARDAAPARAPAVAAPAPVDGLPYPCPDARATLEKDPRTGDLALRLVGCPMGAYAYCPQCPVHDAVQGLRRLVFPP